MTEPIHQVEQRVKRLIERLKSVEQERTHLKDELEQLQSQLSILSADADQQREQGRSWQEERQNLLSALEETLVGLEGSGASAKL